MNKTENRKTNSGKFFLIPAAGFILEVAPVLFLADEAAVTVCSLSAWFMFLAAEKKASRRKQLILTLLLFVLSFALRYCASFGTHYIVPAIAAAVLVGVLNALALLADHLLIRRGHRLAAVLTVPAIYLAVQYLQHVIGLGNYFDPLGYSMLLPLYSMNLSRIGEYGLIFVTALILSLIADSVSRERKERNAVGLIAGLSLAAVLTLAGGFLSKAEKEPDDILHVAVGIAFEDDMIGSKTGLHSAQEWKELFQKSIEAAAENSADLLVLHEEYYVLRKPQEEEVMTEISGTVKACGVPALVGFMVYEEDGEKYVNKAVLFDGQGNVCMSYVKNNLIPFIESSDSVDGPEEPGVCSVELGGREIRIAAVICFDLNDAEYIKKIPGDTELLLVPSWEWNTTNLEQRRLRMRSVELNTTVLKHTFEGFTFASGPWGLYQEMTDNRGVYETVRMIDVPVWQKQSAEN